VVSGLKVLLTADFANSADSDFIREIRAIRGDHSSFFVFGCGFAALEAPVTKR